MISTRFGTLKSLDNYVYNIIIYSKREVYTLRIFSYVFILVLLVPVTPKAQTDLNFVIKDVIDLPGSDIGSLVMEDMNNDDFLDYCYCDDDNFYVVDGLDLSIIETFPKEPGFSSIRPGDLNNDGLIDIALFGWHQIVFYLAPDYIEEYIVTVPDSYGNNWDQSISELYFNRINDDNLIFIGISLYYSYFNMDPYILGHMRSGRILIYQFLNNQLTELTSRGVGGKVKEIKTFSHGDTEAIILRTWGDARHEEIFGPYYDYVWADIFSIDNPYECINIWSVGERSDFTRGEIGKLFVGKPDNSDDNYLYFHSFFDIENYTDLTCIDNPDGNIFWNRPAGSPYSGEIFKRIAMIDILGNETKELIAFDDSCKIRNPHTGYLYGEGEISGQIGYFREVADQENDGIDEFFYYDYGADSIYIYNIGTGTSVYNDDPNLPNKSSILGSYPNPFNAATTISYSLPEQGEVAISIYNLLGQRVDTIFEGTREAGEHTVVWDAVDFPSGVYFARLEAGELTENIKMVLLK